MASFPIPWFQGLEDHRVDPEAAHKGSPDHRRVGGFSSQTESRDNAEPEEEHGLQSVRRPPPDRHPKPAGHPAPTGVVRRHFGSAIASEETVRPPLHPSTTPPTIRSKPRMAMPIRGWSNQNPQLTPIRAIPITSAIERIWARVRVN